MELKKVIWLLSVLTTRIIFVSSCSDTAELIFKLNPESELSIDSHLESSKKNYNEVREKVMGSVNKGSFIYVEDGEADDHMQSLLRIMRNKTPKMILLQGGKPEVRDSTYNKLWSYFANRFPIKKPYINTIHDPKGDFTEFDKSEGFGLFSDDELADIEKGYRPTDYVKKVLDSQRELEEVLKNNDFTTVLLKTAPNGIVESLERYKHKVGVIWTGAVRERAHSEAWEIKFNYYRGVKAADRLIQLQIPIVITSPWLKNTRLTRIVDRIFMDAYRKLDPPHPKYPGFNGFVGLANLKTDGKAMFSKYINSLFDRFKAEKIKSAEEKAIELGMMEKELESKRDFMTVEKYRQELNKIQNTKVSQLALANNWKELSELFDKEGITFREFCPVDQTAELVLDPELHNSVKEVIQVEMERSKKSPTEIDIRPSASGNIYILSDFNSELLEQKLQVLIDWMAKEEPPFYAGRFFSPLVRISPFHHVARYFQNFLL